jgi:hypothetical protein
MDWYFLSNASVVDIWLGFHEMGLTFPFFDTRRAVSDSGDRNTAVTAMVEHKS